MAAAPVPPLSPVPPPVDDPYLRAHALSTPLSRPVKTLPTSPQRRLVGTADF